MNMSWWQNTQNTRFYTSCVMSCWTQINGGCLFSPTPTHRRTERIEVELHLASSFYSSLMHGSKLLNMTAKCSRHVTCFAFTDVKNCTILHKTSPNFFANVINVFAALLKTRKKFRGTYQGAQHYQRVDFSWTELNSVYACTSHVILPDNHYDNI